MELGKGVYGIHNGTLEGVPCLTISNKGTGKVGEPTNHADLTAIDSENEVMTISFLNKASIAVLRFYVEAIDAAMEKQNDN